MEYMTASEASAKWGVTLRHVQRACKNGAIRGVIRKGRVWLLPADAQRPCARDKQAEAPQARPGVCELFLTGWLYRTPGTVQQVAAAMHNPADAALVQIQLAYYQGNIDEACAMLKQVKIDGSFDTRAGLLALLGVCAMYRSDILLWKETRLRLADLACASEAERQKRDFWLAVYDSAIYDNAAFPQWFRMGKLSVLPPEYAPFARFYYVKYLFVRAYDLLRVGAIREKATLEYLLGALPLVCEPLIAQTEAEGAVISEIGLRLLCAAAYHCVGNDHEAAQHTERAIALALPDRIYAPLAENRSLLDTVLDDRLRAASPAALQEVRRLSKQLLKGWSVLHNSTLARDYSSELTAREREAARLAIFGLSNERLAERLGVSIGTAKAYIQKAMEKTGARNRFELSKHI